MITIIHAWEMIKMLTQTWEMITMITVTLQVTWGIIIMILDMRDDNCDGQTG